jgi:hypothetical protein
MLEIDRAVGIAHYWTVDALVEQGSMTGLFQSTLDASRMKHGRVHNLLRHRWNCWRRRRFRKHWVRARHALTADRSGG